MKQVGIADFKAHLSQYLREAREGEAITVTDRGTPVARLGPAQANGIRIRSGKGDLRGLPLPPPNDVDFDVVEMLLQDRGRR
ncbi:MAG: type II toxin-antitoxin system prevent-host-death family antitoxin [Acidobacteria bacterium]|nr:MAG: type II toxin-antitoxin system prevent-host-death family antitoxin [Acidobacteriota bacterium]